MEQDDKEGTPTLPGLQGSGGQNGQGEHTAAGIRHVDEASFGRSPKPEECECDTVVANDNRAMPRWIACISHLSSLSNLPRLDYTAHLCAPSNSTLQTPRAFLCRCRNSCVAVRNNILFMYDRVIQLVRHFSHFSFHELNYSRK